jgi:hypothetical protein
MYKEAQNIVGWESRSNVHTIEQLCSHTVTVGL